MIDISDDSDEAEDDAGDEAGGEALSLMATAEEAGERLDKVLAARCADYSRERLKALILDGKVRVDGAVIESPKQKVREGQSIELRVPPPVDAMPKAENIPLDIIYEDDDLLVINKPVGLVVHPGAGNWDGTLVNALLYHCGDSLSGIGGVIRPGIVHRLDKDTSGLMVAAKNDVAHRHLAAQLADRSLSRTYLALAWKVPSLRKGTIDKPIGRHPTQRQKMAVTTKNSRNAVTHYQMLEAYHQAASLVQCKLQTGRTHQVRVHMAALGHPLIGDPLYGLAETAGRAILKKAGYEDGSVREEILSFPRQALHAHKIGFIHPRTEEKMAFAAPMPDDMARLQALLAE